jgi:GT2 family glycosyltransferase
MDEKYSGGQVRGKISIVIPTVGRTILRQCLGSIAHGSALPGALVVVDQSSNSEIAAWLEPLREAGVDAQYVPSCETGKASAVNRGIERTRSDFIAFTDDDCLVAEDWLEKMLGHLEHDPSMLVTGQVEAGGDGQVPFVVSHPSPAIYRQPRLKFDRLSGGNMGVSRGALDRIGLLDEDLTLRWAEDSEWAYRALRAGVPIKYAPDVIVCHYGWRDSAQSRDQYRNYAMSCGGFYGKYLRRGDWFIGARAGVHYLRELRRYINATITGNTQHREMSRACLRWLVPGILAGLRSTRPDSTE